jgi:hypothetical protein
MKYYLAGPMSGIPQNNFPLFDRAALQLREAGYTIVSPAELDDEETRAESLTSKDGGPSSTHTWGDFLSRDVKLIADSVDGIIFLPNWEKSRGARLEAYVALLTGKTEFALYHDWRPVDHVPPAYIRSILKENI